MSAIEELRALLDEHGVEHYDVRNATYWGTDGAGMFTYSIREGADGLLNAHIHDLTPEQAIAATLGGGECEDVSDRNGVFKCSHCGCEVMEDGVDWGVINFCPDCGKAVER